MPRELCGDYTWADIQRAEDPGPPDTLLAVMCECPSCGCPCWPEDLEPGGEHYVCTEGRIAGYCEHALAEMTDEDFDYPDDRYF